MSVNDWNGQGFLIETVVSGSSTTTIRGHCEAACLWGQECPWHLTLVCLGYGNASDTLLWPLLLVQVHFRKAQQRQHPGEEVVLRKGECHTTTIEVSDSWESSDQSEQRHCETYQFDFVLPFHCKKTLFPFVMTFFFIWLLLRVILMYNKRR